GKARPASPLESTQLGFCAAYREDYRTAVRFYADAFTAEPGLASPLRTPPARSDAACCAAAAAAGKGKHSAPLGKQEPLALRRHALTGLRPALKPYRGLLEKPPQAGPSIQQRLAHWLGNALLAGVRDTQGLAKLPEEERQQWQKLWVDVAALRKKASPP